MSETMTGLIERVTYHNLAYGFAVLKVQVKGLQDLVAGRQPSDSQEASKARGITKSRKSETTKETGVGCVKTVS
jgi:hypothetical protein